MRDLRSWLYEDGHRERLNMLEAALICRCLVDDSGARLFRDSEVDLGTFDDWDAAIVKRLGFLIDEHTGFTAEGYDIQLLERELKN